MRCRISLLPLFDTFGGSEGIDHEPQSVFAGSMLLSSLQALVIPMLSYLTEHCSTRLAPLFLFLCEIFAVRPPGMPSVVSVHHCFDMVSCASSWVSAMSVLQHPPIGRLFNRITTPFSDDLPLTLTLFHFPLLPVSHSQTVSFWTRFNYLCDTCYT